MLEHLFNCHGEWTYLLALLDSFPALRLWINDCPPDIDYALKKWERSKLQTFISKVDSFLDWRKNNPELEVSIC